MKIDFLDELKNKKNLLAFSHGTDSTALFYALLGLCEFDLCLVNYHTRISSNDEENSARNLATKYNKNIFIKHTKINSSNFESKARDFRYEFFDELMNDYDNLILAHNLNDRFEWFLMQLSKGAGVCNLVGFSGIDKRKNYKIIRPLINVSKDEIMSFLAKNNYKYFQDESNFDKKYKRNEIRINYANDFIKNYANGVKKSFEYLQIDKANLDGEIKEYKGLMICSNQNAVDKAIKKLGFISSAKQKAEVTKNILKNNDGELYFATTCICISFFNNRYYVYKKIICKLDKKLKNEFRIAKVPNNLRFYLAFNNISIKEII